LRLTARASQIRRGRRRITTRPIFCVGSNPREHTPGASRLRDKRADFLTTKFRRRAGPAQVTHEGSSRYAPGREMTEAEAIDAETKTLDHAIRAETPGARDASRMEADPIAVSGLSRPKGGIDIVMKGRSPPAADRLKTVIFFRAVLFGCGRCGFFVV